MKNEIYQTRLDDELTDTKKFKSVITEFDNLSKNIQRSVQTFLGYPINENSGLSAFYQWYYQSGLLDLCLNNAGDPFSPGHLNVDSLGIEKLLIQDFAMYFDFPKDEYWGMVTNGGTDGNNHGIYFGKRVLWEKSKQMPILYVSDQAHYSNRRLGHLQGLEVRMVPTDEMGCMIPSEFKQILEPNKPALIVYAMGTTFKGAIDDIEALNNVIKEKNIKYVYRHLDAALFGGYLIFTGLRFMVSQRQQKYDSIAISGHKFFGIDEPCGIMLCTKKVFDLQHTDSIPYLAADMPMISCSRSAHAPLKLYWLLKIRGYYYYARIAYECLKNTVYLFNELKKIQWPVWLGKASNTVFFRRPSDDIMHKYTLAGDYDKRLGGDLAHIIVMPHVHQPLIDRFLWDLKKSLDK